MEIQFSKEAFERLEKFERDLANLQDKVNRLGSEALQEEADVIRGEIAANQFLHNWLMVRGRHATHFLDYSFLFELARRVDENAVPFEVCPN